MDANDTETRRVVFRFTLTYVQRIHFTTMYQAFGCVAAIPWNEMSYIIFYNGWPFNKHSGNIWTRREDWNPIIIIVINVNRWTVLDRDVWDGVTVASEMEMDLCSLVLRLAVMFKSDIEKESLIMRRSRQVPNNGLCWLGRVGVVTGCSRALRLTKFKNST